MNVLDDSRSKEYWFYKGNEFLDQGKYNKAINAYDKALAIDPSFDVALNNKGVALSEIGRYNDSLEAFNSVIALHPDSMDVWYSKAGVLKDMGYHNKSLEAYDKALELDPENKNVLYDKAVVLKNLGRYEAAIESYDEALEVDPNFIQALMNKGSLLFRLGEQDKAIECYERALEINPHLWKIWFNKGLALYDIGLFNESLQCFNQTLQLNPQHEFAWNTRAQIFRNLYPNETRWTRYVNNRFSYSFEIPIDWRISHMETNNSEFMIIFHEVENYSTNEERVYFTEAMITNSVKLFEEPITSEIIEIEESAIKSIHSVEGEINKTKTEINDKEIWIFEYEHMDVGYKQKDAVFLCSPTKIIAVGVSAKPDEFSHYEPLFNRVINSVEC